MSKLAMLNGWQRLWLVIAAIVFIYLLNWSFSVIKIQSDQMYRVTDITSFSNPKCSAIVQMPAGKSISNEPDPFGPCWQLYLYRLTYNDAAQTAADYVQHINSKQNMMILMVFGFEFALWLTLITLLYGVGSITAWVIRGFRSRE